MAHHRAHWLIVSASQLAAHCSAVPQLGRAHDVEFAFDQGLQHCEQRRALSQLGRVQMDVGQSNWNKII